MRTHKHRIVAALAAAGAITASAAVVGSAPAQPKASAAQAGGVSGNFSAVMMIHTSSSSFGDLPGVKPWNGASKPAFGLQYRSIPCTGNAPVNNISSDLPGYGNRVTGSRSPSSMRAHPFGFRVRKHKGRWEMLGSVKFTVCKLGPGPTPLNDPVADTAKPQIVVGFRATFKRESRELLRWSGRFTITGGTQRYADLKGSGQIAGYFMCFAPEGCSALGSTYRDGQFVMHGRYSDPTPQLAG